MQWFGVVRALALAVLLTSSAFVGGSAPPQPPRVLESAQLSGWQAVRDRETGVIARMWGGLYAAFGAVADAAIAERTARSFIAQFRLAPGTSDADLVIVANRLDGGLRTVAFEQRASGLRVVGGQVHVVFGRDRVVLAGSEARPDVRFAIPRRAAPSLGRIASWLGEPRATSRPTGERVVVWNRFASRVADVVETRAGLSRWEVYVAPDGEPLGRSARTANATSTLRFDVPVRHPASTRTLLPAPNTNVIVDGVPDTTDAVGGFAWAGNLASIVEPTPVGPFVQVFDESGAALVTATLTAQPGQPVDFSLATDEIGDAQLTGFLYASVAKARARTMHPTLVWLDETLEVHVNIPGECNAQSTGDAIHFVRKGMCENTARVTDVVLHEFAHSFHSQSVIPGVGLFDSDVSEGIADFFSAHLSGDSGVGRGFRFDDTPVRELNPIGFEPRFPDDISGDPHISGLIIGGALWDLRTELFATLGVATGTTAIERIYVGILQRSLDLPTTYMAALLADDDNADLADGTPNGCAIERAFGRHGLVPGFTTTTLAPPTVRGREITVAVDRPMAACPRAQVTRMTLRWQLPGGALADVAMTANGDLWSGSIIPEQGPEIPDGSVVHYQVIAELDDTSVVTFPDNPADPLYQVFIGTATAIYCERLDRDPLWVSSGWEFALPFGRAGDAPVPFTGLGVLGTNVIGDGRYSPNSDATITMPAVDATGYDSVHVQFRRWLTSESADRSSVVVNGTEAWSSNATLDHVDKEWRFVDVEVEPRPDLVVTWSLDASATNQLGGWNLDDVCIVGFGKPAICGDGVIDIDEACDGEPDCTPDCQLIPAETGCCSGSGGPTSGLLALALFWKLLRSHRRRNLATANLVSWIRCGRWIRRC